MFTAINCWTCFLTTSLHPRYKTFKLCLVVRTGAAAAIPSAADPPTPRRFDVKKSLNKLCEMKGNWMFIGSKWEKHGVSSSLSNKSGRHQKGHIIRCKVFFFRSLSSFTWLQQQNFKNSRHLHHNKSFTKFESSCKHCINFNLSQNLICHNSLRTQNLSNKQSFQMQVLIFFHQLFWWSQPFPINLLFEGCLAECWMGGGEWR